MYSKKCTHCRGRVEFPIEDVGQETVCPHCRRTLTLPTREQIILESRLTMAIAEQAQSFYAVQQMLPIAISWARTSSVAYAVGSAILITWATLLSSSTTLAFLLWPWCSLPFVVLQGWNLCRMANRQRPSPWFAGLVFFGVALCWFFWAYVLGYVGAWRTIYVGGEFGFYPTGQNFLYVIGGLLGIFASRQLARANIQIQRHIQNYNLLLEIGLPPTIE